MYKDEIEKILELERSGKITREQMEELLKALGDKEEQARQTESERSEKKHYRNRESRRFFGRKEFNIDDLEDYISNTIQDAIKGSAKFGKQALKTSSEKIITHLDYLLNELEGFQYRGANSEDYSSTNNITLSKLNKIDFDEGSRNEGNRIKASKLEDFTFASSVLEENRLNASQLKQVSAKQSTFAKSNLNGASITELSLDESEFLENTFNGTKASNMSLQTTYLMKNKANGSSIKNIDLSNCSIVENVSNGNNVQKLTGDALRILKNSFNGCSIADSAWSKTTLLESHIKNGIFSKVTLVDSECIKLVMDHAQCSKASIKGSKINDVELVNYDFSGSALDDCQLSSTVFQGDDDQPAINMKQLKMTKCKLKNCCFKNCNFEKARLKSLDLVNINVENVDFSSKKFSSNEEFITFVNEQKATE